jgi:N,N'-diacetyllegionaminate synthase
MIGAIRNIEVALGDGRKCLMPSEIGNRETGRKSIVASQTIKSGELFTESNLTTKRPGTGISPIMWDELVGMKSPGDFERDQLIEL